MYAFGGKALMLFPQVLGNCVELYMMITFAELYTFWLLLLLLMVLVLVVVVLLPFIHWPIFRIIIKIVAGLFSSFVTCWLGVCSYAY